MESSVNQETIITVQPESSFQWSDYFNEDGYYTVFFQIFLGFVLGLILAPFSLGLFIFIIVYFFFELLYAYRRGFKYTPWELMTRFSIFLWALLGFLFARFAIGDKHPFHHHYDIWEF